MAGTFDAFVSYARKDEAFVDGRLVPALAGRGKTAWVDRENLPPGAEFPSRIEGAIRESAAFLFVLSPDSAKSDWCRRELEEAVRQQKRLVPILVRDVEEAARPRAVKDVTWVRWLTAEDDARATGEVLDVLEDTVEWRERQAEIATRAHEWRLRGDRGSLLRGRALKDAEAWLTQASLHGRSPTREQAEYIDRSRRAQTRWRRGGVGALLGVVAVTSVLALVAWRERGRALDNEREAEAQTRVAQSRELAANARTRRGDDPQLALILALVAVDTSETDAAEEALRSSLAAVRGWSDPETIRLDEPVVALGPAGGHAVTRGDGGRLAAWRLDEPARPVLTTPAGEPLFSPDERLLAVRATTGSLGAWRLTGEALGKLSAVAAADFDRDGRLLAAMPDGLVEWDPVTGEQQPRALGLREGVRSVIAFDRNYYATVDDRRVSLWNPLAPGNGGGPVSEYEEPHGIDRSWPNRNRGTVATTNARGSAVISTITSTLISRIPLGSLRAVAFSGGGELMLAAPSAGPPALARVETGEIVSRLPRDAAGATAVAFAGESILVAAGGVVRRYACAQCASLDTVVRDARTRIERPLTGAERELFLREPRATPCPLNDLEADPCLELFPDSGPPGTVVEVRGLRVGGELSFVDATGASRQLEPLDAPTVSGLAATRLGTVKIPDDAPQGPARIEAGSAAERAFRVTCAWCYRPR